MFNPDKQVEDSPLSNGQRAENAEQCLKHVFDYSQNDKGTAVSDLLANLMHLCDREGIDFDEALSAAQNNHSYEK